MNKETGATEKKPSGRKPKVKKAQTAAEAEKNQGLAVTKTALNLRNGPGYDHDVIRILDQGEKLTMTGSEENGFTSVLVQDGAAGWACTKYLEVIGLV